MPRDTNTRSLGEIVDELDGDVDSAVEDAAQADGDQAERLQAWGATLDQRLAAFEQLVDEYGEGATVTIASLTPGERSDHNTFVTAAIEQWEERHNLEADHRDRRTIWWAAAGVVDAPWFDAEDEVPARAAKLSGAEAPPWPAIEHLGALVTEANSLGNAKRKRFSERLQEKRTQTTPRE